MHATRADVSHAFASTAAAVRAEDLGEAAAEAARMSVLDTLAVSLAAGGQEPAVRAVLDLVADDGGRAEATVWATGRRVPATAAALANGALAHGLDFDDQTPWGQHASSSVVPAALAVAERRGGVSGRDLLAAVAAGQDLFARLRCTVGWRKNWNLSSALGVYAGAAAAGRVLGLPASRIHDALGIASQQSAGVMQVVAGTGSDLRGVYAGFSARGAVTAALLAERGLRGVDALFEGPVGVFATFFGGQYDRTAMTADLGLEFRGAGTLYKLWPAVGTAHSHLHAVVELVTAHDLQPEDIAEIRLAVGDYHQLMCSPLADRRAPSTRVDAKFSLPFLVAVAAVHRTVRISHVGAAGLADTRVLATAGKVVPVADPALNWVLELPPGRVEVVAVDGRRWSRTGRDFPGSPGCPTTWDDLTVKAHDCAAAAAHVPAPEAVDALVASCRALESVDDVAVLPRLLTGPRATSATPQEDGRPC